MKLTGMLQPANGRAELSVNGETFSAPARYSGRSVTIEVQDVLPPVITRTPANIFGAAQQSPAAGGSAPGPSTAVPDRNQRVVTEEDLEVLG